MERIPGKHISFWVDTMPESAFPPFDESALGAGPDQGVDVVVVGGGIVGVTSAYLLKRAGARVCLVEATRLLHGVTGHTTAKVTCLHGLIYADLASRLGEDKARLYGDANQAALEWIADTIRSRSIDCDFARADAYTVVTSDTKVSQVEAEVEAARRFGLPASYVEQTELPFAIRAGVRFEGQARFHPTRYLMALAATVPGDGSFVFEHTRARKVDPVERGRRKVAVTTERGTIHADWVILATHMPFPRATLLWARTYPEGHCVFAVRSPQMAPEGMYLIEDAEPHSVRVQPAEGGPLLIISGTGHKTGHGRTSGLFERLLQAAHKRLDATPVYRWWTQDYMPIDGLPFVGRLNPLTDRVLTATGFKAWGMTNGTAAALLLSDLVQGKKNAWASLYDPERLKLKGSLVSLAKENTDVLGFHLVGPRLSQPTRTLASLQPGEGGIVTTDGRRLAAYKSEDGTTSTLSPVCTHVGCYVEWNDAEKTWDCPCHGSRFRNDGRVINAPATADLKRIEEPRTEDSRIEKPPG